MTEISFSQRSFLLRPQAIAALCALRRGPCNTDQIRSAVGDADVADTTMLLDGMSRAQDMGVGTQVPPLVSRHGVDLALWHLTDDGLGWLRSHGFESDRKARGQVHILEGAFSRGCPVHQGAVHGGEAEELRSGIEALISWGDAPISALQELLDRVEARDSLGHLERIDLATGIAAILADERLTSEGMRAELRGLLDGVSGDSEAAA